MDSIDHILAIQKLQKELSDLRQARIDEASEGFGEPIHLSQEQHDLSQEQQEQGLDFLKRQFATASQQEAELTSRMLEVLTKEVDAEESHLSTWVQQCDTASRAFDSFESLLLSEVILPISSPRSPSFKSSTPKSAERTAAGEGRASVLNFSVLRSKRQKARAEHSMKIDNTALLDQALTRLREYTQQQSFYARDYRIAHEHLMLPYFYELGMYAEVVKELKQKKVAAETHQPKQAKAAAKPPVNGRPVSARTNSSSIAARKKPGVPTRRPTAGGKKSDVNKENPKESTHGDGPSKSASKPNSRPSSGSGSRSSATKDAAKPFK